MSNKTIYVLRYKSGDYVKVDDTTGPMSTGGYPYNVKAIEDATHFTTVEEARKYGDIMSWREFEEFIYNVQVTHIIIDVHKARLWTGCNRQCEPTPESMHPDAVHYLNCSMLEFRSVEP